MKEKVSEVKISTFGINLFESNLNFGIVKNAKGCLPFYFFYNSEWLIEHICPSCKLMTSFGMKYKPEVNRFPVYDFQKSQLVCEKNFSRDLIVKLDKLFSMVNIIEHDNQYFLAHPNKFNKQFPVSSSINVYKHNCYNCSTTLLSYLEIYSPIPPDNGLIHGKLGKIVVNEILVPPICFPLNDLGF